MMDQLHPDVLIDKRLRDRKQDVPAPTPDNEERLRRFRNKAPNHDGLGNGYPWPHLTIVQAEGFLNQ